VAENRSKSVEELTGSEWEARVLETLAQPASSLSSIEKIGEILGLCTAKIGFLTDRIKDLEDTVARIMLVRRTECECKPVYAGFENTGSVNWSDGCPEHGVGTDYFRNLPSLPFGYSRERNTSREEWMKFLAS
jgi:hypothetical protein